MKFKALLLTFASLIILSCNHLNLKNPSGSVLVSLPGTSSRGIVSSGENVSVLAELNFPISYSVILYSSDGKTIEEKTAMPGSSIEFADITEGSYIVKAFCYVTKEGLADVIAAANSQVEVNSGEISPVNLELTYNRISNVKNCSVKYKGPYYFTREEWESFSLHAPEYIYAELEFNNGWVEYVPYDTYSFSQIITEKKESPYSDKDVYALNMEYYSEGVKSEKTFEFYVYKELVRIECATWSELADAVASAEEGTDTTLVLTGTTYGVGNIEGETTIEIPSGTNICITTSAGGKPEIYFADGTPGASLSSYFNVYGTLTLKAADNGNIKLANNGKLYLTSSGISANNGSKIYIQSGVTFNLTSTSANGSAISIDNGAECYVSGKVNFTSCTTTNGLGGAIYNKGKLEITGDSADPILFTSCEAKDSSGGAIYTDGGETSVKNVKFNSNKNALYITSAGSVVVDSCIFTENESIQTDVSGYGDVYLNKDSEETDLKLTGNLSGYIGLYVKINTDEYYSPDVDLDGISLGTSKIKLKLSNFPSSEYGGMLSLFGSVTNEMNLKSHLEFAISGLEVTTNEFTYEEVYNSGGFNPGSVTHYFMLDGSDYSVYVNAD